MVSGINEQNRAFARRLAAAGLTTLLWDPYPGLTEDQREGVRVDDEAAAGEHVWCVDYLVQLLDAPAVGVIGWCMGGRMALTLAAREPRIGACVAYFPTLRDPRRPTEADAIAVADRIACPVQVMYGGQDHVTSPATFGALRAALERRSAPTITQVYPAAEHGFLSDEHQSLAANRGATRLAWPQTLAFLQAALTEAPTLAAAHSNL